ncbi:MAG: hypothetical protein PHF00_07645, partial [Elusimicrobia bacterium]|nr:hypothetical protein [Elusimicrobiota bacterium]
MRHRLLSCVRLLAALAVLSARPAAALDALDALGLARVAGGGLDYTRVVDGKPDAIRLSPEQSQVVMEFVSRLPRQAGAADEALARVAREALAACGRGPLERT